MQKNAEIMKEISPKLFHIIIFWNLLKGTSGLALNQPRPDRFLTGSEKQKMGSRDRIQFEIRNGFSRDCSSLIG